MTADLDTSRRERRQQGVALALVMVFTFLLITSVTAFARRVMIDATIVENRDAAARAEALARGGIRLATAVLLEDRLRETQAQLEIESPYDAWARLAAVDLASAEDAELRVEIQDAGARLNLNAFFSEGSLREEVGEQVLAALIRRAMEEATLPPELEVADPDELARNLIDFVDADNTGLRGGFEDDWYQQQDPPYRAENRPLLSVDELGLVRGFEPAIVDALRPYVTVFPYVGGEGINPNTAPAWVLSVLVYGLLPDFRFADERMVGDLLRHREDGGLWCAESASAPDCRSILDAVPNQTFPPLDYTSDVFEIRARAEVKGVRRTVEAVIDRSDATAPRLLSWRVR